MVMSAMSFFRIFKVPADSSTPSLLDVSVNTAGTVRATVLHIVVNSLYVLLKLVVQRKSSSIAATCEGLNTISWVNPDHVSAQIQGEVNL